MKSDYKWGDLKWRPYTIATCSAVLLYLFLSHINVIFGMVGSLLDVLEPIIIGLVIAYLVSPFVHFLEKYVFFKIRHEKLRYNISVILAVVIILVVVSVLMSILIPQIAASVVQFIANLNYYSDKLSDVFKHISDQAALLNLDVSSITAFGDNLFNEMAAFLSRNANKIINSSFSLGGKSMNFGIGLILAMYFLADKKGMIGGVNHLLRAVMNEDRYTRTVGFLRRCNGIMSKYVAGDIIDALIVGLVTFVFMAVTGMPYATLISVVVGITNLAPTFGPFVGAFIGAFILIFAEPRYTLVFLIFALVLQMVDGYVIKPKLFGDSLGVPGVWIVIGVIIGGKAFGVLGILMAIPTVAIVDYLYHEFLRKRERKMKLAAVSKETVLEKETEDRKVSEGGPSAL